jgi:hypothetical protein
MVSQVAQIACLYGSINYCCLSLVTLYEFNKLNDAKRAATTMQGNFVDVRLENNLRMALYSHPNFHSEVFYNSTSNQIVRCRTFTSLLSLAAYIHLN